MNNQTISENSARPKLTRFGLKPPAIVLTDKEYFYNHVSGRRAPRCRYATAAEAFFERKRLEKVLGPEFVVKTYRAVEITEETK